MGLTNSTDRQVFLDDEDLHLLDGYSWSVTNVFTKADGTPTFYVMSRTRNPQHKKTLYLHRLIMDIVDDRTIFVDHRDGNGLNNRRSNLRLATNAQNQWNRKQPGELYYVPKKGYWRWRLQVHGKRYDGACSTEEKALERLNACIIAHRGEFAVLRQPRVKKRLISRRG